MSSRAQFRSLDQDGSVAMDLKEILRKIPERYHSLSWSLLEIQATGDLSAAGWTIERLEKEVLNAPTGVSMKWGELVKVSELITQTIDLVLVCCRNETLIPRLAPGADLSRACELVVRMHDSTFWEVYSRDGRVVDTLRSALGFEPVAL